MSTHQETPESPQRAAGCSLGASPCTAFRGPIERHQGTIRVSVDVQREGAEYWARAVPDPVRPYLMPLASGQTRELAIHAACEKASILPNVESIHLDTKPQDHD